MTIQSIIHHLESIAPANLQESYDNAGLLTGNPSWNCTGIIVSLDATEAVVTEAAAKGCNLIVAHHPIIFGGLKKITGKNYVEKTVIAAIKNDIAIFAIHTNLDNVLHGVNARMADQLGLLNRRVLAPKKELLQKLVTYVPTQQTAEVQQALFEAGAGNIGNYSECSFVVEGKGTFRGSADTQPFVGKPGMRHSEPENQLQVIFPQWLQGKVVQALLKAHPYEEVAYDILPLYNTYQQVGSGLIGDLPVAMEEAELLQSIKKAFNCRVVRHTPLLGKPISRVALCGGAGSFLTGTAIAAGAQLFITGDVKYHEFFDANSRLVLADIGHFESEQYTIDLLFDILSEKYPTFAVLKTGVVTNPVQYI